MVGFPHSEILGSKLIRSSPGLIAAYYVLHRLHAPRHPLDALKALDRSHYLYPQRPRPLLQGRLVIGQRTKDHVLATWSFDRSDQKKPEFTCCRCLSPRVWDQTSSEASLYDVERSGSVTSYKGHEQPNLLSNYATSRVLGNWWSRTESNRRHPACKAGALPTELRPHAIP
jgi:hypothetical protein